VPEQQKADAERQLWGEKQLVVSQSLLLSLNMSSHRHMQLQLQSLEAGGDCVQKRVMGRTSANISDLFISLCDGLTSELKWGFVYSSYCSSFPSSRLHAEVLGNHLPRNRVLRRISATLTCASRVR
jgi:hypothetical protein